MSEVQIRAARPADADAVVALDQASFSQPWAPHVVREAIERAQGGDYIALVAQSETVIGFVIAWTVRDEGEIATIAVSENARGQGIGEKLVRAALHESARRGAATVFLEVRPHNQSARRLYEKCGFQVVGLRKNYYRDGDDAVLMKLEIK
jgi:[ribosomal protein S18]-alanine N-acetyltransferase